MLKKSLMKSEIKKLHHKKFLKRLEMKRLNFTSALNGMIVWQQNDTDCNRQEIGVIHQKLLTLLPAFEIEVG